MRKLLYRFPTINVYIKRTKVVYDVDVEQLKDSIKHIRLRIQQEYDSFPNKEEWEEFCSVKHRVYLYACLLRTVVAHRPDVPLWYMLRDKCMEMFDHCGLDTNKILRGMRQPYANA